jgi:D-alanine--poly(phosphoribitol) ligase subunit 2
MSLDAQAIQQAIKAKIIELVAPMGEDASDLEPDDIIPATGLIDSAGLLELIAWYEHHFKVPLKPEEVTIDNLGSLAAMANFVLARRQG